MARPRDFVEEDAVRAARDQFWETGYAGTSITDLTVATGLGKGSLYATFTDKHELFLRAFEDYCSTSESEIREALLDGPGSALSRLETYVLDTARSVAADTSHRGCMLAKATAELANSDPAVVKRALGTFTVLERALGGCIEQAQRDGDLDPAADSRAQAGLLLAVLRGIEALGKAGVGRKNLMSAAQTALAALPRL